MQKIDTVMHYFKSIINPKNDLMMFFILLSGVMELFALGAIVVSHGENICYLIWHAGSWGIFPDFFESLKDASMLDPYQTGAIYPALVYVSLSILSGHDPAKWVNWGEQSLSYRSFVVSTMLFVFCWAFVCFFASFKLKMNRQETMCFSIIYWLSPGFLFGFERGNLVLLVVCFVLFYVCNYDSESGALKELALISLAIAASFKIYPAVLGLLLVLKKDIWAAIRCFFYGVSLFIFPFVLKGGLAGIIVMVNNIFSFSGAVNGGGREWGYGFRITISNLMEVLLLHFQVENSARVIIGTIVNVTFVVLAVFVAIFAKKEWQKVFALVSLMTLLPGFSWLFTAVYFFVPLVVFLRDEEEVTVENIYYLILFLPLIVSLPYGEYFRGLPGIQKMSFSTIAIVICGCMIVFSIFVQLLLQKIGLINDR